MEEYYFSASENQFLAGSLIEAYKESQSWPDDAVKVSQEVYQEFSGSQPPPGKSRGVDGNGLPVWEDTQGPDAEELVAIAKNKKERLLSDANGKMIPLQFAVELAMETEEEKHLLERYKKYIVLLSRIDVSQAPNINWPVL